MSKKWYNWEMFVQLDGTKVVNYHLNSNVVDVTNNCNYHRVSFPIDKWKYDNYNTPKSIKEVSGTTLGNDSVNQYPGFFIAFEIPDRIDSPKVAAQREAANIFAWLSKHRGFW
jgi:hypothetical protein